MKKILIISCVFSPEPVVSASISMDIAIALSINNDVTVISPKPTRPLNFKFETPRSDYPFKHIMAESFTFPQSKLFGRMKESFSFGRWCEKYIDENYKEIDVIYMNSWPMFSQLFIAKRAAKYKIRLITHVQDIYPESIINKLPALKGLFLKVLLPMDKNILKRSNIIFTISQNMRDYLHKSRGISLDKFKIITNWQNAEDFIEYQQNKKHSEIKSDNLFTFMYLGNNGPVAGVEFLIDAFVKASIKNAQLIIAGSGSKTDDCKNLVNMHGATNIKFITVPDGKVPEIQDLADVMLLPVKKNGAYSSIPSKLPAYMFSSKPILGSLDVDSDTAKAILDAKAGIVVEPENQTELINAMKEMSDWNSEMLKSKGSNGFQYAVKNFSKTENLNKITTIIEKF